MNFFLKRNREILYNKILKISICILIFIAMAILLLLIIWKKNWTTLFVFVLALLCVPYIAYMAVKFEECILK